MKTNLRLFLLLLFLGLGLAAVAAPAGSALAGPVARQASATRIVKLQNIQIHPSHLVVGAGDRVTWQFLDGSIDAFHTVTSVAHAHGLRFKGVGERKSGSYSVTFRKRGTYYYQCMIHTFMRGTIAVR